MEFEFKRDDKVSFINKYTGATMTGEVACRSEFDSEWGCRTVEIRVDGEIRAYHVPVADLKLDRKARLLALADQLDKVTPASPVMTIFEVARELRELANELE